MNRRDFLSASIASVAGLKAGCQPRARDRRPNVLIVMTDEQTAGMMSNEGNTYCATPAMDRIAAMGMRFDRSYCIDPICVPSRASLFTGRPPHEIEVTFNIDLREIFAPSMGKIFLDAGYDTGFFGKWHIPMPVDPQTGVPNSGFAWHGFGSVALHRNKSGGMPTDIFVPASCESFLREERDAPFLLVASFINPHDICEWARNDPLIEAQISMNPAFDDCPPLPANFEIPENEPEAIRQLQRAASARTYPTLDWGGDRWRQYRWAYARMIETVDEQVGRLLDLIETTGHLDDTVIVFTSDHGDGNGAHRWNQKTLLYEEPSRVPLIVACPGESVSARSDDEHLVSMNLDVLPTICDYAGIDPPASLPGRSLRALAAGGPGPDWRDHLVVETDLAPTYGVSEGNLARMVRSRDYKYCAYVRGEIREQLMDLRRDPGEMRNFALDPDYLDIVREHRRLLADWVERTGDIFPLPG